MKKSRRIKGKIGGNSIRANKVEESNITENNIRESNIENNKLVTKSIEVHTVKSARRLNLFTKCSFFLLAIITVSFGIMGCAKEKEEKLILEEGRTRYELTGTLDTTEHILDFTETVTYQNTEKVPLSEIYLHLYGNAYQIYDNTRGIQVLSVHSSSDKNSLSFEITDRNQLIKITPENAIVPGETLQFTIACKFLIPDLVERYGYYQTQYCLSFFQPQVAVYDENGWDLAPMSLVGDGRYHDMSDYKVEITVPREYIVACGGTQTGKKEKNNQTTYLFENKKARDLCMSISNQYEIVEDEIDDIKVYAYFEKDLVKTEQKEVTMKQIKDSLHCYQSMFGDYPYPEFRMATITQKANINVAMEYSGMIYMPREAFLEGRPGVDFEETLSHEIAHQWFYGIIGNNETTEAWLDEGITTYAVGVYLENTGRKDLALEYSTRGKYLKLDPTPIDKTITEYQSTAYYMVCYYKAQYFLYELRQRMGEEAFFSGLRKYYDTFAFAQATTEGFIKIMTESSSVNIEDILEEYLSIS